MYLSNQVKIWYQTADEDGEFKNALFKVEFLFDFTNSSENFFQNPPVREGMRI